MFLRSERSGRSPRRNAEEPYTAILLLNLYVEKKTLAKAMACMMTFNTASAMTNLSLLATTRALCSQFLVNEQICEQSLLEWTLKLRRNTPALGW